MRKLVFTGVLVLALSACTTTGPGQLYYWGEYEDLIYNAYHKPGDATAGAQIERLTRVVERARNTGKPVAPGIFAHLGMLYAMIGNPAASEQMLVEEKTRFPESTVFVDGLLERARKMQKEAP